MGVQNLVPCYHHLSYSMIHPLSIKEAYHNTFSLEIANDVPYLHKSKFATCIRRMLRLACRKLRKYMGFRRRVT